MNGNFPHDPYVMYQTIINLALWEACSSRDRTRVDDVVIRAVDGLIDRYRDCAFTRRQRISVTKALRVLNAAINAASLVMKSREEPQEWRSWLAYEVSLYEVSWDDIVTWHDVPPNRLICLDVSART